MARYWGWRPKICATMVENNRACEDNGVFDGQRLAMKAEEPGRPQPSHTPTQSNRRLRKRTTNRGGPPKEA